MEEKKIREKHWKQQTGNKFLVYPTPEMVDEPFVVLRHMKFPPFNELTEKEEVLVTFDRDYVIDYIGHKIIAPLTGMEYNKFISLVGEAYRKWKKNEANNKP